MNEKQKKKDLKFLFQHAPLLRWTFTMLCRMWNPLACTTTCVQKSYQITNELMTSTSKYKLDIELIKEENSAGNGHCIWSSSVIRLLLLKDEPAYFRPNLKNLSKSEKTSLYGWQKNVKLHQITSSKRLHIPTVQNFLWLIKGGEWSIQLEWDPSKFILLLYMGS